MLRHITKFNQIPIIPNSLIVLDIDETIIKFDKINEKWWKNTFDKHYLATNKYDIADNLSLKEWISYVTITNPILVDNEIHNWINSTKKLNCELILLTARNTNLQDITLSHLNFVNLNFNKEQIYFNKNKGDELLNITKKLYSNKENIIIVDDVKTNLLDIKEKFIDTYYNLHLYNML